jgi:hypothetical protein
MRRPIRWALAIGAVLLAVSAAGLLLAPDIVQRAVGWGCSPDRLPERISGFERTTVTAASLESLPPRSGLPQGRAAVVVDWPGWGFCPTYDRTETDLPMAIWLRVSPTSFVEYGRGGGP